MATKKYVSLSKLSVFLDNLKTVFAYKTHDHVMSDISDLSIDEALSNTSTNPVQNKVIDTEFKAVKETMGELEVTIDSKADISSLVQSDWDQEDETSLACILNKPRVYRNRIVLTDSINGFDYVLKMENGNLVTYSSTTGISIAKYPSNSTFFTGDPIDISDMVLEATCSDGSTREVKYYTYEPTVMDANTNKVTITYEEDGNVFTVELPVIGESFESKLMDFDYKDNGDGTYTITGWKETLNGEPSTRMIVPNSNKVII